MATIGTVQFLITLHQIMITTTLVVQQDVVRFLLINKLKFFEY